MENPTLKLMPRTVTGKKVKKLRRQEIVPVLLYGQDSDSKALQVQSQVLRRLLPQVGTNIPVSVEIEGQEGEDICFVREVQRHPVTEDVLHVDFMRVDISQTLRAEVPVVLTGTAPAVRNLGGTLLLAMPALMVEALPMNIPALIQLDVSELDDFEKSIYVRDVPSDSSVIILADRDELIARVSPPRIEVEEVSLEEEAGEVVEEGQESQPVGEDGSPE